jgi:hypothetical protein
MSRAGAPLGDAKVFIPPLRINTSAALYFHSARVSIAAQT